MISNIPTFTQHQDFQARHADMLAAARQWPVTIKRIVVSRELSEELKTMNIWADESLTAQERVDAFLTDR